jgi:acetyltransferase-like isoleucine patch superfamily enzyme
MLEIAASARISELADIEDSVRGSRIVIGERCMIDSFVKIKPAGGSGDVILKDDVYVNSGSVIYTGNGVRIGKKVLIGANCVLAPVNHAYRQRDVTILEQGHGPSKGGIVIGDDVWLGAGVMVLDGAVIGKGCVVAAGSVVRGELEPYGIYGGNPIAKLGQRE